MSCLHWAGREEGQGPGHWAGETAAVESRASATEEVLDTRDVPVPSVSPGIVRGCTSQVQGLWGGRKDPEERGFFINAP